MDNLAVDYEKKERLENVRAQQVNLNRATHADNYAQAQSFGNAPRFASHEGLRRADNYPSVRADNYPSARKELDQRELHLRQPGVADRADNYAKDENGEQPDHASRLDAARGNKFNALKNAAADAKGMAEAATPMGAFSLLKEVNILSDMPFVAAFGAAILKDILDGPFNIVLIGALFSVLCSIFIFMMMFLEGAGGKKKSAGGLMKKGLVSIVGGVGDAIPGIGFLPIMSLTVGITYLMTLAERRNNSE